jgi:Flp pilus assembly protein TadD
MAFAHHVCGTALTLLDRSAEAIAHLEAEMKASPGAHTHYLSLCWQANAMLRAGRLIEAEAAIDESLSLNPDYNIAIANKALLCLRGDREAEARTVFSHARNLEPDVAESLWELRIRRRFCGNPIADEAALSIARLWAPA